MQSTVEGPSSSDDCPFRRTNHQRPAPGIFTPIYQLPNSYPALTRRSKNTIDSRGAAFVRGLPLSSDESSTPLHPVFSPQTLNYRTLTQHKLDSRGGRLCPTIASFVGRIINAPQPVSHSNLSIAKPLSSTNSTVDKCNRQSRETQHFPIFSVANYYLPSTITE